MENAGMWLRVSKSGQDEASQIPDNEHWIKDHEYGLKRTYTIHGKSAFKGNRKFDEAWQKVLNDIRDGIITVLVTWKQDRIDRKLQTFQMIAEVVKAGGRVEFVTQPQLNDLSTMAGRISLKIAEEMAYEESKIKSERILANHAGLKARGSLIGKPPFGYSIKVIDGIKTLTPNKLGRKYVREIFARCIAGDSTDTIARWLTQQKVPTSSGGLWSRTVVGKIIRNRTYAGYRVNSQGTPDLECTPIVKMHIWNAANEALDSRPKRGPVNAGNRAMLASVLRCAGCDSPMYRMHSGRAGKRVPYYRCNGSGPQRKGCGNMIRLDVLDKTVDEMISDLFRESPETERKLIPGHDNSAELARVAYEMSRLFQRNLTRDEVDSELARLRAEEDRLNALPSVPDSWSDVPTGRTLGNVWDGTETDLRGAWLKSRGFAITVARKLSRDPRGSVGHSVTVAMLRFPSGEYGAKFTREL